MLVSCLMPTLNRRRLIPMALQCFLAQDWPEKELIVIDDGDDHVGDMFADIADINYSWWAPRRTIGAKLNEGCKRAKGDILVRWDDDDWSAPGRISDQVARLLHSGKSVTGYHSLLFWDAARSHGSKYSGSTNYALGTSLCFQRKYWKSNPFRECSTGEDNAFIRPAQAGKAIASVDAAQMMVARIHAHSVSKRTGPTSWPTINKAEFPPAFFEALGA